MFRRIPTKVFKEAFPQIFQRPKNFGDRILRILNIVVSDGDDSYIKFEDFHKFARYSLFYDATFGEMVEFVIMVKL